MIDVAFFTALVLIFIRIISVFLVSPIMFPKGVPKMALIGFCIILSYVVAPVVDYSNIISINSTLKFFIACLNEALTGIMLGYIIYFCFLCIRFAGQLMDMQIGFAMINILDPLTQSNVTLLGNLFYWVAILIFLLVDGHHILIKSLIESFKIAKLGTFIFSGKTALIGIKAFINFFSIGIKLALPIVLTIIVTELVLGLVARTVPQLNVMVLGLPIKIVVGLLGISFALPIMVNFMIKAFQNIPNSYKELFKAIPLLFVFASDDKTEEATPKKKNEARKKGQIAKSKELSLAFTLMASTLVIAALGDYMYEALRSTMTEFLNGKLNTSFTSSNIMNIIIICVIRISKIVLPAAFIIMIFGILINFIQTGYIHTKETLKPDIKKLNPISGFKRMFSKRTLVELVKDIALVIIVGNVGYKFLIAKYPYIMKFGYLKADAVPLAFKDIIVKIFFKVSMIMFAIAILDFAFQKYQYKKDLMMTKEEVKEEFKQDEGDPLLKSKRRQRQREIASRRMIQNVPDATVVITNPTHISVAIKYNENENSAPVVIAKGQEHLAFKIKEVAKEHNVPIIENKPLARLIYSEVDIDSEIPIEMYEAVAEVLAIVFKMKKK